jgi:hypothetical protein
MSSRLSWKLLKEAFAGEWVELIDYQWDWSAPHPRWARVEAHASDRGELLSHIQKRGGMTESSLILYIGATSSIIDFDPKHVTL